MITLENLGKEYTNKEGLVVKAVDGVDLSLKDNSITMIVGKSGCGKTTLLRLLDNMETATQGKIIFSEDKPKIGYVFQEPRLMPWLTVKDNIAFAYKHDKSLDINKAAELLKVLDLEKFANSYPKELSGGMAQRVALGRTLFQNPDIILMDEPFSALDFFTRRALQQTLLELFNKEHKTIVFVTHDVGEALLVGERVLVMSQGKIIEDLEVTMKQPRDPAEEEFQVLRKKILEKIV